MVNLPSLPKFPSPADILKDLPIKKLLHKLGGDIPSGFDARDVGEVRLTFGDVDKDGNLDVRVRLFAKTPIIGEEPEPRLAFGPYNVHIDEAMRAAGGVIASLPVGAAPVAGAVLIEASMVLGTAETLLLQHG